MKLDGKSLRIRLPGSGCFSSGMYDRDGDGRKLAGQAS